MVTAAPLAPVSTLRFGAAPILGTPHARDGRLLVLIGSKSAVTGLVDAWRARG